MSSWSATTNDGCGHTQPCSCVKCSVNARDRRARLRDLRDPDLMDAHSEISAATIIQKNARVFLVKRNTALREQCSMFDRWNDAEFMNTGDKCLPCDKTEDKTEDTMTVHPKGWTKRNHYSELGWQWCGQSCPCCRAECGDTLGACPLCVSKRT
jgi:hypothetical protein